MTMTLEQVRDKLQDPSELAITGAERTAKQIHDEAGMPPATG